MSDDMLDTTYLFQPRGPGTKWFFRLATPAILIGRTNSRTGKTYRPEVRESTKTRDLKAARRVRNVYLANIERDRVTAIQEAEGSLDTAMQIAADYRSAREGQEEALDYVTSNQAEKIEERAGYAKAKRWHEVATGEVTPLKLAYEKYLEDAGKAKSRSSLNNLKTAISEFYAFAGSALRWLLAAAFDIPAPFSRRSSFNFMSLARVSSSLMSSGHP